LVGHDLDDFFEAGSFFAVLGLRLSVR